MFARTWLMATAVGCAAVTTPRETREDSGDAATHSATPAPATGTGAAPGALAPPPSIAGESSWCWFVAPTAGVTSHDLGLFVVGMDSGTVETVGTWPSVNRSFHTAGLAYTGTSLVMSGYDGNGFSWYELDLASGTLTRGPEADVQVAVTALDGALVVAERSDLEPPQVYDDFAALVAGTPSGRLPRQPDALYSRAQIAGAEWFGAWHATHEIQVFEVATGALTDTVPLERFDTWVWGLGIAGGRIHVIDDGRGRHDGGDVWVRAFDRATGALVSEVNLASVPTTHRPSGLYCEGP